MRRLFWILVGLVSFSSVPSWGQVRWSNNGHFYEMVPTWRTWLEAKADAESRTFMGRSGHLMTVTSQAEQDFVVETFGEPLREASIGGYNTPEGWKWVTGETWEYTNWAPGEPNGSEYLAFHGGHGLGQWNDRPNSDTRHYFVEYPVRLFDVLPETFQVTRGNHVFGVLSDLFESDDRYIIIGSRYPFAVSDPSAQLVIETTAPPGNVRVAGVLFESAASIFNIIQRVELFDFSANRWVILDERSAGTNDSEVLATNSDNPGRFVQQGTLRVRARFGWFDRGAPIFNWQARTDRAVFAIAVD
ncbi:MAG: hypothetical protein H0W86_05675 [Armatimonadetes bacterium]|nr:hypothetical protein [Armatimonadota bacterium]